MFGPLKGSFASFEWLFKKCTYSGHDWDEYSSKYNTDFVYSNHFTRTFKMVLYYRECKRCGVKVKKEEGGFRFDKEWIPVDSCPPKIKKYLRQPNLDDEGVKKLEEYITNTFDI